LFLLFGVVSGINSLRAVRPVESGRVRFLIALHDSAKAGFWLSLGAFFLGFALIQEVQGFRWFAMVPLVMAGLRLATAAFLSRS
jgi:predicted membrane metal-binding protein